MKIRWRHAGLLTLIVLALIYASYTYYPGPNLTEKPIPLLDFGQRYAEAVARYDFTAARAMGSETNRKMLDGTVIPRLERITATSQRQNRFHSIAFEKSLMYSTLDHMEVIEKLTPVGGGKPLFLRFEVNKLNGKYTVLNTYLEDFAAF
ncbi:MAG: hypothetical protein ACM3QZ_09555 [Solirubrobacterales bacterium]